MKLFTKEIDKKLFDQYSKGNNLESQMVVAKIFNPYGRGTWYIVNSDPEDSDYLWAIVDLFEVEIGSVLRSELESIKVPPFRLGLERDTSFRPINAKELYDGLRNGKHYAHGGSIEDENREMVLNENNQIIHHTKELPSAIKGKRVPAWVVTKVHESASDLSDATHYMDGQKMAKGGGVGGKLKNSKVNITNDMRGEDSDDYGTFEIYKNGGNIEVKVVNSDKQYNEKQYEWILGDKDKDSVANADDVKPLDKNTKERIDEPTITTGIKNLISLKKSLDSTMYSFIEDLKNVAPNKSTIYARTKTPYSVLDKLIKKRLSTITDLIGTTIVTNDKKELDIVKNYVESGKMGKVVEMEDMYEKPKQGYRAYHFLIERNGMTIELQVKTKRQKALNELSHEPYKLGKLNSTVNLKMTELANRADEGDKNAIKEYNDFMNQPNLEKLFYADGGNKMATGGKVDYDSVDEEIRSLKARIKSLKEINTNESKKQIEDLLIQLAYIKKNYYHSGLSNLDKMAKGGGVGVIKYVKGKQYMSGDGWVAYADKDGGNVSIKVDSYSGWDIDPHRYLGSQDVFRLNSNGRLKATVFLPKRGFSIYDFAKKLYDTAQSEQGGNVFSISEYNNILKLYFDMQQDFQQSNKLANGGEIDTNVEMIEDKDGSQYLFPKNSKNKTLGVKFANGGYIESLNAPNSYLNIFTLGVKLPSQEKIVSSSMSPSHFSRKSLTLTLKGGSKEVIPEAKISDFLKGKQIDLRDTNGESYAIQLNRLNKMAMGGSLKGKIFYVEGTYSAIREIKKRVSEKRLEQLVMNGGIGSLLTFDSQKEANEYYAQNSIIGMGLATQVNILDRRTILNAREKRDSQLKTKMAKGGTLSKSQLKHFKEWMEDGNVSKNNDGTYSTQDAQYRNKLKDLNELKKYFKKEFAVDEYATGGGVGEINTPFYFKSKNGVSGFDKDKVFYVEEIPSYGNVKVFYYDGILPRFIWFYKSALEEGFANKNYYKVDKSEYEKNKMAKGGGVDKTYSSAKTMGKESQDFKSEAIDYVGGIREWNKLTEEEKRQIIVDLEKDWDRNKYKKGGNVNKVAKVMHEFKEGNLHSGKSEKIVTNPKQAIAIALSEAKNNSEKKGWKHKK